MDREEVDFSTDLADLRERMTPAEQHLINRLVAYFATGDSIVGNNLVLNLYKHINSPEARMYLSRQLFEEAQHVDFYLTLLDTYIAEPEERKKAFDAVENSHPSARKRSSVSGGSIRLTDLRKFERWTTVAISFEPHLLRLLHRRSLFLRGFRLRLLSALARVTARPRHRHQLGFRDESAHIQFALEVIHTVALRSRASSTRIGARVPTVERRRRL